jgi:hypothetical protein
VTAPKTIKVSPRRALFEVRKPVSGATKVEPSGRRYRRTREHRVTREIVADEAGGC